MSLRRYSMWLTLATFVCIAVLMAASALAQPQSTHRFNLPKELYGNIPRSPEITLSVDRGEGASYKEGEPIAIQYRTTGGGYVNLLNYLPDGEVHVLVSNQFVSEESDQIFNDTVYGPSGTNKLVILFTPDEVADSQLEGFVRQPHQADQIIGRHMVNRTHYEVITQVMGTTLQLDPVDFSIDQGSSVTLTAILLDASGNLLTGRALNWTVTDGELSAYNTVTGENGRVQVTFHAPTIGDPREINISVHFAGDERLSASSAQSTANLNPRYLQSQLSIQPSSFNIRSGDSIRLVATLEDGAGNPVYGRTIYWVADQGSFDRASAITNSAGRSVVNYYPPEVEVTTDVVVTAEFPGVEGLAPVSLEIYGTVDPPRTPPPTSTLFFVDFGGGSPNHNVSNFQYSGSLVHGYTTSGTAVLEMTSRDTIEFNFNPGGLPVRGLVLVWLESQSNASLDVHLNNRRVGSITPNSGSLDLDHESRIAISSADLVSGSNRMVLSVDGPANSTMAVQRIVIMF